MNAKILTINACILIKGLGFTSNDKKKYRLEKMLSLFNPYDIICIQEIWECFWGKHTEFYNACKEAGWIVAATKVEGFTNTGNVILSRHFIEQTEWMVFGHTGSWQRFMSNGVLYAKIHLTRPVHVFTTHLHCDTHPCFKSNKVRHKQLLELKEYMKQIVKDGDLYLLCGDFNIIAPSDEYDVLTSIINARSILEQSDYPNTYNNLSFLTPPGWKNQTELCIDHIFTNMSVHRCCVLTKIDLSDHFPIEMEAILS